MLPSDIRETDPEVSMTGGGGLHYTSRHDAIACFFRPPS